MALPSNFISGLEIFFRIGYLDRVEFQGDWPSVKVTGSEKAVAPHR